MPTQPYTSHLSIPYTHPSLPLQTLDLHIPNAPRSKPTYTLIYIHGGAFRDPRITSQSLLPSLPHLFSSPSIKDHIASIASINYRLSPYPSHPTHPSDPDDANRNARWPDHVEDVRNGIEWLFDLRKGVVERGKGRYPNLERKDVILVGHSVGATIAFALAMGLDGAGTGSQASHYCIKAVVGVEGIYDFSALRDAHLEYRGIYEEFTTAALGAETEGGWERANLVRIVREGKGMEGTEVVVLGQSREDEMVEWGQVEMMEKALREKGWRGEVGAVGGREVQIVKLVGGHDEIWEKGDKLAKCA
ncbi:MAG: hypothetical protein Q9219_000509 [cf. Caloplaca sp. 3 TL-2023]